MCRSWFSNADALRRHFGVPDDRELTATENALLAANVQALTTSLFYNPL